MVFLWRSRPARWGIRALQDWRWKPILGLLAMGLLGYIRNRGKRRSAWMNHDDHNHNGNGFKRDRDRDEDARRIDQLQREEMRRYEQDLRELADA